MKTVLTLLLVAATSALTGCSSDATPGAKVATPTPQDSGMGDGAAKNKGKEVGPRGLPVVKEKGK